MKKKFIGLFLIALGFTSTAMEAVNISHLLHLAAMAGDVERLKILIGNKWNINAQDSFGTTALHAAVGKGRLECVRELLKYGANVNTVDAVDGFTPLHAAICINNPQIVQELLNHGVDVNAAVMHTIMAQEHGTCGATPLHLAVQTNNVECTSIILAHNPNIFMTDCFSQTPLHVAAKNESIDCINLLMEHRNQIKEKIRQYAHAIINEEFIEEFIAEETDINGQDGIGCTPLHYAACEGNQEIADILIKNGANVHAINKRNHTPRDAALVTGQKISVLVQAKAIITPEDVTAVAKRLAFAQYLERYMS